MQISDLLVPDKPNKKKEKHVPYFKAETPVEVDTGRNVLRYYPKASRLQVSMPYWITEDTGEKKRGKTIAINLLAVSENDEAVDLFKRIVADIDRSNL